MSLKSISLFDVLGLEETARNVKHVTTYLSGICHCNQEITCDRLGNLHKHRIGFEWCLYSNKAPILYRTVCPECMCMTRIGARTEDIGAHDNKDGVLCSASSKKVKITHTYKGVLIEISEDY